jgi:hypothetical protein
VDSVGVGMLKRWGQPTHRESNSMRPSGPRWNARLLYTSPVPRIAFKSLKSAAAARSESDTEFVTLLGVYAGDVD